MTPLEKVLSKLSNSQQSGNGFKAHCPAHDDHNPSLSIWENDDGSIGVKCHAGCQRADVLRELGLTSGDLTPEKADQPKSEPRHPKQNAGDSSPSPLKAKSVAKPAHSFATSKEAIESLSRKFGKPSQEWPYHDRNGMAIGYVVRWDTDSGKVIRPICREGKLWRIGSFPEPRPLYRLSEIIKARRVFVCEGEKAADALRSIGLVATTSPHGAEAARKSDWTPLIGKEVIVLPDNDLPGWRYTEAVREILVGLDPTAVVKLLVLDGLPEKGDAFDWVDQQKSNDLKSLGKKLNELADAAPIFHDESAEEDFDEKWKPFPVNLLPKRVGTFVVKASQALDVDPAYVIMPLLAVAAAAIGNRLRIQLKPGFEQPACLWMVLVGESGTGKSHPIALVLQVIHLLQQKWLSEFQDERNRYEAELAEYKQQSDAVPADKPVKPTLRRLAVDDITVEALAAILNDNPLGLLLTKDELAGWFASFDRYAKGKGGDLANWLSMFDGRSLTVDRKGAELPLMIPRALVSITGGIQPGVLQGLFTPEHRQSGLIPRLLLAYPPRHKRKWTETGISPKDEKTISRMLERLLSLPPELDELSAPRPRIVPLTPDAKKLWIEFYNDHAEEQVLLSGDDSAAWSKLQGYAARLSLVIEFMGWATGDPKQNPPIKIDCESMRAGIELSRWFGNEAKRIYRLLSETDDQRQERELVDWIRRQSGPVSPRDVTRGPREFRGDPAKAEQVLNRLVKQNRGAWQPMSTDSQHGGRPARRFSLNDTATGDGSESP